MLRKLLLGASSALVLSSILLPGCGVAPVYQERPLGRSDVGAAISVGFGNRSFLRFDRPGQWLDLGMSVGVGMGHGTEAYLGILNAGVRYVGDATPAGLPYVGLYRLAREQSWNTGLAVGLLSTPGPVRLNNAALLEWSTYSSSLEVENRHPADSTLERSRLKLFFQHAVGTDTRFSAAGQVVYEPRKNGSSDASIELRAQGK